MNYRWITRPLSDSRHVANIRRELNDLPEALARSLVLRGVDSFDRARRFFRPSLTALHDPFGMADMEHAAVRIAHAIERSEKILVYGDYDVDGTTATALLVSSLRDVGGDVDYFIPDRLQHGYGLCEAGIDQAMKMGVGLIVSVDCGVTSVAEADYAARLGIELIVCDHHTPKADLPKCIAVIDPKRQDCSYPFGELCGCGVAYKLLRAVLARLGLSPDAADAYLDLVAIATASDVVPLRGENRILLAFGLKALQNTSRLGIRALAASASIDLGSCSVRDVTFGLAPRINAAGRLGDAGTAVALMIEKSESRAFQLAADLERMNGERRSLDKETLKSATMLAERQITSGLRHAIVLHQDDWHLGVLGIVASRLVERFYRPTILLATNNGRAKGSARSIAGINIYEALQECSDLLVQFGGHDYAAGMTLQLDHLAEFQHRVDEAIGRFVTPELLLPSIDVDAEVVLSDVDTRFLAVLKQFEPFGPENEKPIFRADAVHLSRAPRRVGKDGKHLKFSVRRGDSERPLDAIGFGIGDRSSLLERSFCDGIPFDMLFCLEENTWNGRTSPQLKVKDLRLAEAPSI